MPDSRLVDAALLRDWPLPDLGSDKEERGRLVVVAGSRETAGAGLLAAEGAFRVGAGKIQLATARSCAPALAVTAPELMVTGVARTTEGRCTPTRPTSWSSGRTAARCCSAPASPSPTRPTSSCAGWCPGWRHGRDGRAGDGVRTDNHEEVAALDATPVLTVNPGELAHCLGVPGDEVSQDLESHTSRLAARTRAVVVCGGPVKVVAHRDEVWRVEAGNAGLGTAGSGDVQAGIVAGLVARGAAPARRPSGWPGCTPPPAIASPSGWDRSATWPASCPGSCPGCSPS